MRKVYVQAFLKNNLGDDLFVKILCDRYKNVKFFIVDNKDTCKNSNNINNLSYFDVNGFQIKALNAILKIINSKEYNKDITRVINIRNFFCKHMKYNILITGSGFIESNQWKDKIEKEVAYYNRYILGCNFGPYTDEQFYQEYTKLFKVAKQITFRDKNSYNLFKNLENAKIAPDVVFNLNIEKFENDTLSNEYIISVIDPNKDYEKLTNIQVEKYIRKLSEIVLKLTDEKNTINMISFCDFQKDDMIIDQVLAHIPKENFKYIQKIRYSEVGIDNILKLFGKAKGIIATRFHSMILGFLFKKKVIPIIYDHKMTYVLDDIDYIGERVFLEQIENFDTNNLDRYWGNISNNRVELIIKEAKKHFELLDQEFLK